jgi:hypothetical protein
VRLLADLEQYVRAIELMQRLGDANMAEARGRVHTVLRLLAVSVVKNTLNADDINTMMSALVAASVCSTTTDEWRKCTEVTWNDDPEAANVFADVPGLHLVMEAPRLKDSDLEQSANKTFGNDQRVSEHLDRLLDNGVWGLADLMSSEASDAVKCERAAHMLTPLWHVLNVARLSTCVKREPIRADNAASSEAASRLTHEINLLLSASMPIAQRWLHTHDYLA